MRFSNIIPFALAAAPVAVSAAGTPGFSLGAQNPDGSCKKTSDYESDFDALKSHTKLVRTYSADQCNTAVNILPAAKNKGFKVVLAVWLVLLSGNRLSRSCMPLLTDVFSLSQKARY